MTPRSKKLLAVETYGISLYARATCESRAGAPHKCEKYGPLFSPLEAGCRRSECASAHYARVSSVSG